MSSDNRAPRAQLPPTWHRTVGTAVGTPAPSGSLPTVLVRKQHSLELAVRSLYGGSSALWNLRFGPPSRLTSCVFYLESELRASSSVQRTVQSRVTELMSEAGRPDKAVGLFNIVWDILSVAIVDVLVCDWPAAFGCHGNRHSVLSVIVEWR